MASGPRTAVHLALLTLAVSGGWPDLALAHGPSRCLRPDAGPPGTRVVVRCPAYKVVFNPDRADLGIGPESLWRRHVETSPPATVYRRTWEYTAVPYPDGARFVVPDVREGRYLVAVHDGGEGGAHYTWDDFVVTAPGPADRPADSGRPAAATKGGSAAVVWAAISLAVGLGIGWRLARRGA